MTDKYADLRAALDAGPTPGPWADQGFGAVQPETGGAAVAVTATKSGTLPNYVTNTAYIAAANPAAIRALLADHDQWRQQAWHSTDVADAAIERVKELEAERDKLRGPLTKALAFIEANHYGGPDAFALLDECKAALVQEGS